MRNPLALSSRIVANCILLTNFERAHLVTTTIELEKHWRSKEIQQPQKTGTVFAILWAPTGNVPTLTLKEKFKWT